MIRYFLKQYGPDKDGDIFNKDNNHYDHFQRKEIGYPAYWNDLKLLLIQYHMSTRNDVVDFNDATKFRKELSNYSSKEKDISVIIPVILEEFLKLSPQERKKKFADDAMYAVKLVRERLEKKKLDIDFDRLISDLEKCNAAYLSLS